jgi:hypothetical protein
MDEHFPGFPRVDSNMTPGGMIEGALQGHADPRKKRTVRIVLAMFCVPVFGALAYGAVVAIVRALS